MFKKTLQIILIHEGESLKQLQVRSAILTTPPKLFALSH